MTLALGVGVLGVDARWVGEAVGQRLFVGLWYGRELFAWSPSRALELATRFAPGVAGSSGAGSAWTDPVQLAGWVVLVGALLVGATLGARLVSRAPGLGLRLLAALATLFAVCPWMPLFVVERTPLSAAAYLDLRDLAFALGLGLIALGGFRLGPWGGRSSEPDGPSAAASRTGIDGPRSLLAAVLFSVLAPLLLSQAYLDGEPLTNDGVSYRFQAELFADGQLVRELGPLADFFPARQILPGPSATSKYPPGTAAVLAIGEVVGTPRLLPLLFAGLTTLLCFHLTRRLGGRSPGGAAWFFALSPMALGVGSLWLSHGTSLPMGLVFLVAWLAARDTERGRRAFVLALVAGAALSLAFSARPLTAVALALPVALAGLRGLDKHRARLVGAALLGFLPGLVFFLTVNDAVTGSLWSPVYALYAERVSPNDRWGLINLATALPYTAYNLARLSAWLVGAGAGGLLLLFAWQHARPKHHAHLTWSLALSLLGFYALHRFQGVPWAGPLYLVEALPALAVLAGGGLVVFADRFGLSRALVFGALALASFGLLLPHLAIAQKEAGLRRAPALAAERLYAELGAPLLVFVPLDDPTVQKRYPLVPPAFHADPVTGTLVPKAWPVLARDLGAQRNAQLRALLGEPEVRRWAAQRQALDRLE